MGHHAPRVGELGVQHLIEIEEDVSREEEPGDIGGLEEGAVVITNRKDHRRSLWGRKRLRNLRIDASA